jgi:hypothetical protein
LTILSASGLSLVVISTAKLMFPQADCRKVKVIVCAEVRTTIPKTEQSCVPEVAHNHRNALAEAAEEFIIGDRT